MYHNDCFQGQAINPLDTCIDEEVVSIHLFINLRNLRFYLCVVVMVVEVSGLHLCRHAWNSKISKQGLFLVYGLSKQPSRTLRFHKHFSFTVSVSVLFHLQLGSEQFFHYAAFISTIHLWYSQRSLSYPCIIEFSLYIPYKIGDFIKPTFSDNGFTHLSE